jgi:hypothetical protein
VSSLGCLSQNRILAVIDHKFDKTKVVSTIGHATSSLNLRDTGERNGKNKETLVFSKQES